MTMKRQPICFAFATTLGANELVNLDVTTIVGRRLALQTLVCKHGAGG
jgi:hypothetical protein